VYPIDKDFLRDLGQISEASGIALGLDRVLMLCLGQESLAKVIPFAPSNEDD
jgi:lysyl-tRNA synthetase class 2